MKNKSKVRLLGIAVLAIWSLVIYRFVDLTDQNDFVMPQKSLKTYKSSQPKETLTLEYFLNYSEPFAVNKTYDLDNDKTPKENKPKKPTVIPKKIEWPKIKFIGVMSGESSDEKSSFFVEIDGEFTTLVSQDSIGDLKILDLNTDSLYFEKEKERKAIYPKK